MDLPSVRSKGMRLREGFRAITRGMRHPGRATKRPLATLDDRRRATKIPNSEIGDLLFGQQHVTTVAYFEDRVGSSHTVPISKSPHAAFAAGSDIGSMAQYDEYLRCSWEYYDTRDNTADARQEQLERFADFRARVEGGLPIEPVRIYERPDGRRVILDGNHRSSIALALGLDLPAVLVPADRALAEIVANPNEFYGSERGQLPYQTISRDGKVIVPGRRPDLMRRMEMIGQHGDLRGASVLELGCNIGSNCYLAVEGGAESALGLELSPRITTAAIRLNNFFARPCRFEVHDLTDVYASDMRYDVVFCFSVVAHLPSTAAIVETIRSCTDRVLYFEGHSRSDRNDYSYILNDRMFSEVDLVGYCQSGFDDPSLDRPLYRCAV